MKSAQEYELEISKSILILGPPGSGKTVLATSFPGAYVLNIDNNLAGPIRWKRANSLDANFKFDDIMSIDDPADLKAAGAKDSDIPAPKAGTITVPRIWRYRLAAAYIEAAAADPSVETIIIDSLTTFNQVIMDEVRRQYKVPIAETLGTGLTRTVDIRDDKKHWAIWDGYLALSRNLIWELKASGKRLICVGHVTTSEDEQGVLQKFIAVPGQLREQIAGFFEEVWLIEVNSKMKAGQTQPQRIVKTQPDANERALGLKSAAQLKPKFELDFDELIKKLQNN